MAGVPEQLIRPQKKAMHRSELKAMELQTAKEILAEVFQVRLPEVDEMIQSRFEATSSEGVVSKEEGLWPQEFWLEE